MLIMYQRTGMSGCLGVYINVCVYDEHGLQVIINCWGRQIAILPMPTGNVSLLYFLLLRIAELNPFHTDR